MTTPAAYAALQKKKWETESEQYVNTHSIIAPFVGNVSVTDPVGNKVMDQVPDTLVSVKKFKPDDHAKGTTIPMIDRLKGAFVGGSMKAEGNELLLGILNKEVFFNVERCPIAVGDESVEGDVVKWTGIGNMAVSELKNRLVENEDIRFHRACIETDPFLSDTQFWTGGISAPVTNAIHSKVYVNSKAKAAWSATYNTYEGNINTAADALTTSDIFDQVALEKVIFLTGRAKLKPIKNSKLNFNFVALTPDVAYEQLTTGTSNTFMQGFRDAGERAKDNIGLTAEVGVYRGLLIMKDTRSSVFDISATAGSKIKHLDPNSDDTSLARVAPGAGSGTCEMTIVGGQGMLGKVIADDLKLKQKFFDYDFSEGLCSMTKYGYNRMEFLGSDTAAEPKQVRSFIFMTASKDTVAAA